MCGIFGLIGNQSFDSDLVSKFLEHRGPDNQQGINIKCQKHNIYLHHARLSILDLNERSNQPFLLDNLVIIFNGEIYNFKDLIKEFELTPSTKSDTEVIGLLFKKMGTNCFHLFDGPFAIAVFDKSEQKLYLARDIFGEKPLFYCLQNKSFAFSSNENLFKNLDLFNLTKNKDFRADVMSLGFSDRNYYNEINKLGPGNLLTIDVNSLEFSIKNFKEFNFNKIEPFNFDKYIHLLEKSLSNRIISDRSISILLSGGIDSSLLLCLLHKQKIFNLKVNTVLDNYELNQDIKNSIELCKSLGYQQSLITLKAASQDIDQDNFKDNFCTDPAQHSLLRLYESINETVCLTGDGADEIYLSYSSYRKILQKKRFFTLPHFLYTILPRSIATKLIFVSRLNSFQRLRYLLGNTEITSDLENFSLSLTNMDRVLYYYSYKYELPNYLLVKADNCSMRFSKEARSPYLCYDLVQYCISSNAYKFLHNKKQLIGFINNYSSLNLRMRKSGMATSFVKKKYKFGTIYQKLSKHRSDALNDKKMI